MSQERVAEVFDQWATNGRAESMEAGHGSRMSSVLSTLSTRPGDRVLDLGCGNGWMTRELAVRVPDGEAIGVDLSPEMVNRASEQSAAMANTRFVACDLLKLPIEDASIDHVVSMEALYYVSDLEGALAEVARTLRSSGTLTVGVDFYEENRHSHPWPEWMGLEMRLLSASGWVRALEDSGLVRVHQFRSLAPPVAPIEDADSADFLTQVGTLVVRGFKP